MISTIRLPSSRILAYAEYGDPRGAPLFLFHGAPGSRIFHPPDDITMRLGVRLICVDRPGYGGSTFQPGRRILDWPADIAHLADSLGLARFAVAGHSGGGPHTLACAYALPDRVRAAAVLSGAGPADAPGLTEGMTVLNRLGFQFGRYVHWPVWRVLVWWFYRQKAANPTRALEENIGKRARADDEVLADPYARTNCIESETEGYRQGLRGFAWDARLLTRPWGFALGEIRVPVFLWHGTADDTTAIEMGRYMAKQIPNCRATFCEGEAHLLLFPHWEEILTALVGA